MGGLSYLPTDDFYVCIASYNKKKTQYSYENCRQKTISQQWSFLICKNKLFVLTLKGNYVSITIVIIIVV